MSTIFCIVEEERIWRRRIQIRLDPSTDFSSSEAMTPDSNFRVPEKKMLRGIYPQDDDMNW